METATARRESSCPAQFSTGSYVGISIEDPLGAIGASRRSPRDARPWRGGRSDTPSTRGGLVASNWYLELSSSFGKQISQQLMQPQPLGFGRESGVRVTMSGREHPINTSKRSSHAFKCPKEGRYRMGGEDTRVATTVWEPRSISGRAAKERGDLQFQPNDIKAKPGQNAVRRNAIFNAATNYIEHPKVKATTWPRLTIMMGRTAPRGAATRESTPPPRTTILASPLRMPIRRATRGREKPEQGAAPTLYARGWGEPGT